MPQVLPAIAGWVATAFATAGVAVGTSIAIGVFVAQAFVYIGAQYLIGLAVSALQKKPKRGNTGYEVNFAGTLEPRRLIAGTVKVGGMHCIPPLSTGADGADGHCLIVVAGHEVNDITDVYFDQTLIADANIAAITGADGDGLVTAGKFVNKAWIRRLLGTTTQTVDFILNAALPASFGTSFRLRGNAYIAVRCEYDSKIYDGGWPNVTAIVQGQKLYDPRLDSTKPGGAGAHRESDPATWAFAGGIGNNPALYLRHYLTNEVGFSHAEINDTLVMTAANTCDALVAIPTAATQRRWTINTVLIATDEWEEHVRQITDAMRGHVTYVDGVWMIYAGEFQTPDVTINEGDWVSSMMVQASANRDERWNFVRGWYVDPDRNWQRVECYPRRSTAYETSDGGNRIPVEVELLYCASSATSKSAEYEAQRHCEILLRASRNQTKVSGKLRPEFMKLIPGNTVYVNDATYGWSSKSFRIIAVEAGIGEDGGADVSMVEEGAALWTDLAEGEYNAEGLIGAIDPGATLPVLTANPIITVGPGTIAFDLRAAVPSSQPPNTEYTIHEYTVSTPVGSAIEVIRGQSQTPVLVRTDVTTRFYWARAEISSYKSDFRPNSIGTPAAAASSVGSPAYGPPSANLIVNGDFRHVDPATGRLASWDGNSKNHTYGDVGIDGGRALICNSNATGAQTFWNEEFIPVDPMREAIDVSVWLRSVVSGQIVYPLMEAIDKNKNRINSGRTFVQGYVRPFQGYTAGTTSVRVQKPKVVFDLQFQGWVGGGVDTFIVPEQRDGGVSTPAYAPYQMLNWPDITAINTCIEITAINTAGSTSYDTLTLEAGLPFAVGTYDDFGIGLLSSAYKYFPNGASQTVSSTWTQYTWRFAGFNTALRRHCAITPHSEYKTFRQQSNAVTFGLIANFGGGTVSKLYVDQYIAVRRAYTGKTNLVYDPQGLMGGGAWKWPAQLSQVMSQSQVTWQPYSGWSGNGCFQLRTLGIGSLQIMTSPTHVD